VLFASLAPSSIVDAPELGAFTSFLVAFYISWILVRISRIEVVTFYAGLLISPATTPNRSPYNPALEAYKSALKGIIFV
jgi:hypothetical protein